jgi:hypothetical protein
LASSFLLAALSDDLFVDREGTVAKKRVTVKADA